MTHRSPLLAVALALAVVFATPVAAGSLGLSGSAGGSTVDGTSDVVAQSAENDSTANDSVPPGAKFAGVVGVQGAEVSGEVEERAFGIRIAAANSDDAKAAILAGQTGELEGRLGEIRAEQQNLTDRYENDSISEGQYKARMAKLTAEARTLQRLANTTADTANGLPADVLAANGVDVDAIATLQRNASNLTGPEVAAIAREIAGNDAGGPPVGVNPAGNVTDGMPGAGNGQGDDPGVGDGPATEADENETNTTESVTNTTDSVTNTTST